MRLYVISVSPVFKIPFHFIEMLKPGFHKCLAKVRDGDVLI
ncbi:hypothetical protein SAMN06264855_12142 [Halorubrum vacuolatum]|uniref:Uncharacterized protein n=1 Tax=Halorubrum vacuolatum TaxID=63740 RepID=A0A238XR59_HALVU|nr:hypothetical protein SAMN06264855_12142 [Halorubrum vacuolatum]